MPVYLQLLLRAYDFYQCVQHYGAFLGKTQMIIYAAVDNGIL